MATVSERLALLIAADTRGAVKGLTDVGKAADKNLGGTEKRIDKFGRGLSKAGFGMAAFGAAALVGLGKAAKASEDANLQQVKLQNSLDNNPRLAGENIKAFNDLATSIQSKTAADADQITSGMAMLGTFKVTGKQLREITPLVVDYARKFGTDLVTANASVGKALDGSVGALKRNGVSIDETLFKTDRYAAVVQALSAQVGGFAEAEGKTFAGSLERLKNQTGDLVDSVGGGAVEVFAGWADAAGGLTDKLNKVNPEITHGIGKFGAYAGAGLLAAGAAATLAGKVIELRKNLDSMGRAGTAVKWGAIGLGFLGIASALDEVVNSGNKVPAVIDRIVKSASDADLTRNVGELAASMNSVDGALRKLGESSPAQARRWLELQAAAGASEEQLKHYRAEIDEGTRAAKTGQDTTAASSKIIDEFGDSNATAADKVKEHADALKALNDEMRGNIDPAFGVVDALQKNIDAQNALAELQKSGKATTKELADANRDAARSALDVNTAAIELKAAIDNGDTSMAKTVETLKMFVDQGLLTEDQAANINRQLRTMVDRADAINKANPKLTITADTSEAVFKLADLKDRLYALRAAGDQAQARMIVKQLDLQTRAVGGPVSAMTPYLVGERGPELFVPKMSGRIVPNGGSSGGSPGGGGGTTVVQIVLDGRVLGEAVLNDWQGKTVPIRTESARRVA